MAAPPAPPNAWRSRIVGQGEADPATLTPHERNPRTHSKAQLDAIAGALDEVGFVQRVIVNRTTGHILDGHARVQIAIARGEPTVPVVYVELAEEEEALVLASLDPLGALAGVDQTALDALLAEIEVSDDALREFLIPTELEQPMPEHDRNGQTESSANLSRYPRVRTFSVALTPEQYEVVTMATYTAKQGSMTMGEAIVSVCESYNRAAMVSNR